MFFLLINNNTTILLSPDRHFSPMSGEYDIKVEALWLDSKRCMLTHIAKEITAALDFYIVL